MADEARQDRAREIAGHIFAGMPRPAATGEPWPLEQEFAALARDFAFGDVWSRPGIDKKTRSLMTVAVLTALYRPDQVRLHVHGALNHGATPDEIFEAIFHAGVYGGLPVYNSAVAIAKDVFAERGLKPGNG